MRRYFTFCLMILGLFIFCSINSQIVQAKSNEGVILQGEQTIQNIFPDDSLATVMLKALKESGVSVTSVASTVTQVDLDKITSLTASGKGVKSIEGIQYLHGIKTWVLLNGNDITDLSPLANWNCLNINNLQLYSNHISDVSPIAAANLPQLNILELQFNNLTNNCLTDVERIANNSPNLFTFDLSGNHIDQFIQMTSPYNFFTNISVSNRYFGQTITLEPITIQHSTIQIENSSTDTDVANPNKNIPVANVSNNGTATSDGKTITWQVSDIPKASRSLTYKVQSTHDISGTTTVKPDVTYTIPINWGQGKDVVVHYQTKDSKPILPDKRYSGIFMEEYEISPPEIKHYAVSTHTGSLKGIFGDTEEEVTFVYDDQSENNSTTDDSSTSGTTITTTETTTTSSGQKSDTTTSTTNNTNKETITKETSKKREKKNIKGTQISAEKCTVVINYVDTEGHKLHKSKVLSGNKGASYHTKAIHSKEK